MKRVVDNEIINRLLIKLLIVVCVLLLFVSCTTKTSQSSSRSEVQFTSKKSSGTCVRIVRGVERIDDCSIYRGPNERIKRIKRSTTN